MDISGIDYLGLERVIRRGSGEIIADRDDSLFIRDTVSGAYMLACEDVSTGIALLDQLVDFSCDVLTVTGYELGKTVYERYGFKEKLECYQVAYYGEKPAIDRRLCYRAADENDLPMLAENYHLISYEELKEVVRRNSVILGYDRDQLVGFIGEHLEGAMGLLYIIPEHRRKGFGAALQTYLIALTMEQGYIPFAQVQKDNMNSLGLQKKIGMTQSDNLSVWMWR